MNKKGKMNEGILIVGAIVFAAYLLAGQGSTTVPPATGDSSGGGVDLCQLVDGDVSFTGQNTYLAGTALTEDFARVIKVNGGGQLKDLGYVSMDSGVLATTPGGHYKVYYGENTTATSRYTSVEDYTAPCSASTDQKTGYLCTVDTDPTVTVFDENGQVQSGNTGAQSLSANDIVDVEVKIKAASDSCFGNPESPKKNAICFEYNTTVFDSVKANGKASIAAPYAISSIKGVGTALSCFEFDKIADTGSDRFSVKLDAGATQPTGLHNISIYLDDTAFDLDQDTLTEIWGFEDESNNALGSGYITGDQITISN